MFKMSHVNIIHGYVMNENLYNLFNTIFALYDKNRSIAFVNMDLNEQRGHSMMADPCFHVHV